MPNQALPALARRTIIIAGICAIAAGVTFIWAQMDADKQRAIQSAALQQCQDDMKAEITLLQDFVAAKKAEQASGKTDPGLGEKAEALNTAIQTYKARC